MRSTVPSRIIPSASARDQALEVAFAHGAAWAYEMAYDRFGARLYAVALAVLHDRQSAQDCMHDVLLALWRKRRAYTPQRGGLEAFLIACVRNDALARIRGETRRAELRKNLAQPPPYEMEIDPIEEARVAAALRALDTAHREVVDLAYYRGLTHREIAAALAQPVGTIKSRISAALRSLRRSLHITEGEHG